MAIKAAFILTSVFALNLFNASAQSPINGRWDPAFGNPDFGGLGVSQAIHDVVRHPLTGDVYVGGGFLRRIENTNHYVLRWSGTEWSGLSTSTNGFVFSLDFDHEGNLYAGGDFSVAGGNPAANVARWDGSVWTSLGQGVVGGRVFAIQVDPATGDVYVGGEFTAVVQNDGTEVDSPKIAKWNGQSWESVGRGGTGLYVDDIAVDPVTSHPFVGGRLFGAMINPDGSTVDVEGVASWNGNEWAAVDDGSLGIVHAISFDDDGNLYVGHEGDGGLAIWDRESWSLPAGGGFSGSPHIVRDVAVDGDRVYVAGRFGAVIQPNGSVLPVRGVAVWDRVLSTWRALGAGIEAALLPDVNAIAIRDEDLFVGGQFEDAGGRPSQNIARWSETPPPYAETRVTFQADYRAAIRKGLLANLDPTQPTDHHPIVELFDGPDAGRYFLYDVDGDSIWSIRIPQPASQTIDYAFAFDVNGNGYNDQFGGDWIYELGGAGSARSAALTGASSHTLPVVPFDNRTLLSVDPEYTYRIVHRFPAGNPGNRRFELSADHADVFIDLDRLEESSNVAVRWYTKDPGGDPPAGILTRSENSYWVIDIAPLAADYEGMVEFDYDPIPGISEETDLRLLHRIDGSAPWSVVVGDVDVNDRVMRLTGITDFTGEWTLGSVSSANPLSANPPVAASDPTPSDGNLNVPIRPLFEWSEVPGAHRYDLYFWDEGASEPVNPFRSNLTEPRFQYESDLIFGNTYNWRVVATNINGESQGAIWSFTVGSVPDLIVAALDVPGNLTSGQLVEIQWTVTNQGDGGTNAPSWFDEMFVSEHPDFHSDAAVSIGRFKNVSFLNPGESYSNTQTVTLTEGIQGIQYVHVLADAAQLNQDRLDESDEGNNGLASEVDVTLAPFADLRVTSAIVPTNVFSGDSVTIQWTVENEGSARTSASSWFDSIFLSDDEHFDFNFTIEDNTIRVNDQFLGRAERTGSLDPGGNYAASARVRLPDDLIGSGWIFVYSDIGGGSKQDVRGSVYEFNVELNNWTGDSLLSTLTPPPDLVVTEVQPPADPQSGALVDLSWTVENQGPGATRASNWLDNVYLSSEAEFDRDTAVLIGALRRSGVLDVDATYTVTQQVRLPDGIAGDYHFFVETDPLDVVFEHTFESNNVGSSVDPVAVSRAPYPDLTISSVIVAPSQSIAGEQVAVTYTVQNNGAAATGAGWTDSVYVSANPDWDPFQAIDVLGVVHRTALDPGAGRSQTVAIRLPSSLNGSLYVYVKADAENRLFEYPDTAPNETRSSAISVGPYPPVDLAIEFEEAPSSASTGQTVTVRMRVTNLGEGNTLALDWGDDLYLSTNDVLDQDSDHLLSQLVHEGVLRGGESYVYDLQIELPEDAAEELFLIASSDSRGDVAEVSEDNNVVVHPLTVTLTSPADLRVTNVDAPAAVQAGQPVQIAYAVTNEGPGVTRSKSETGGWYDHVYLSVDRTLDARDALLGSRERTGGLEPGSSYTDSVRASVPSYASGSYYFIVQTDRRDDVYEHAAEGDNLTFQRVELALPAPSDLVVSAIDVPAQGVPGEEITVSWTIENTGSNPAQGLMRDALFLSADEAWDLDDRMLGVVEREIDIAPGGALSAAAKVDVGVAYRSDPQGELTEIVPGVDPGDYFIVVRTDAANTIREIDDANNARSSTGTVNVDVPVLTPGVPESVSMRTGQTRYYRLDVGANKDVRLTLTSDDPDAANQLYVGFGRTPNPGGEADFSADEPFTSDLSLVVPSTQDGPYYVLVLARTVSGGEAENVTVLADLLGFEVAAIAPNRGGQGQVTTVIEGGGFRPDDNVFLRSADGMIEGSVLDGATSTGMRVRFQLGNDQLGLYDVVVERAEGGEQAVIDDGFEVEEATALLVDGSTTAPKASRAGGRADLVFEFTNVSNVDVPYVEAVLQTQGGPNIKLLVSGGFLKPGELFADSPDDPGPDFLVDDDTFIFLMIARDVPPGQTMRAHLVSELTPAGDLVYSKDVVAYSEADYLKSIIELFVEERLLILANPQEFDAETVTLAANQDAFITDRLQAYVEVGLLDELPTSPAVSKALSGPPMSSPNQNMSVGSPTLIGNRSGPEPGEDKPPPPPPVCHATFCRNTSLEVCRCKKKIPPECFNPSSAKKETEEREGFYCQYRRQKCDGWTFTPKDCGCTRVQAPCDPNDILGPDGYGAEGWISGVQSLPYTIRFENDPEKAQAPAQVVRINHPLDPDVDARSFRLGDFGFGPFTFSPPANRAHYQARLDVVDSLGVLVDVTAGIDVVANQAFWVLTSVDPETGDQPRDDPFAGFLPVNDDRGSGEGFVSYTVRATENANTGDVIDAQATIFFDINAPIDTPPISNTIDADHPVSRVTILAERQDSTVFQIDWSGSDVGAGVGTYSLYVSRGEDPFELYGDDLTETSTLFVGEIGYWYRFFVVAEDVVGNREPLKGHGEGATKVSIEELYDESLPKEFALYANYPNPFNPATNIEYDLPTAVPVRLTVYNTLGQRVSVLLDEEQAAGRYRIVWDAGHFASGVYFYRIEAGDFAKSAKMILVK